MKPNKTNPRTDKTGAERRLISRVVHDERGNGTLEWVDVTDQHGFELDALTLQDGPLSVKQDVDTFNPYERTPVDKSKEQRPVKRDLRKLSEWIKATRAVEEKKSRGED